MLAYDLELVGESDSGLLLQDEIHDGAAEQESLSPHWPTITVILYFFVC